MPDETTPPGERRSLPASDSPNPYQSPTTLEPRPIEADTQEREPREHDENPSPREEDAARALKSAALGVLFCPLQFYTLWLLFLVLLADEPLRPRYFWYAVGAASVLVPYLLFFAGMLFLSYAG